MSKEIEKIRSMRKGGVLTAAKRARFEVIVIGASAGGLHALTEVLRPLSPGFSCSIVVVQHLHKAHKSLLSDLLGRVTELPVKEAVHGEPLLGGVIYLATADKHLIIKRGFLSVVNPELVSYFRPSIDLMFESAAKAYGSHCVGVVLSGSMQDGCEGLRAIKQAGGTTMAELPEDAEFKSMPQSAIATGCVDYVVPLAEIASALTKLCENERNGE